MYKTETKLELTEADIHAQDREKFIKTFDINADNDGYFDLLVDVHFDFYPPCKGFKSKYGEPLEPDTPSHLEINAVEYNGKDLMHYIEDICTSVELPILEQEAHKYDYL